MNPVSFAANATVGRVFKVDRALDYEGEVIRTKLVGTAQEIADSQGKQALLSVPGRISDIYSALYDEDGTAAFYTRNIYGNTDMVLDAGNFAGNAHLEMISPFAGVKDPDIPALPLSPGLQERILSRSMSMQIITYVWILAQTIPSDVIHYCI